MKNTRGITLISLVITIAVLSILASIATYSGINIINSSKMTAFSTELKIMQTQVNAMYENKDNVNVGETIDGNIKTQADKVFTASESGITSQEGYKYWSQDLIKGLGIEGVEQDFFINLEKRSVVSYQGFTYEGKTYYTLEQIPSGLYNVEYNNPNGGQPTFEAKVEKMEDQKWRITIPKESIVYTSGYIDKWQVQYQLEGKDYWNTTEDLSFVVREKGNYKVKIQNGNIISEEKTILIQGIDEIVKVGDYVAYAPQSETTSYTFESKYSGYENDQNISQDSLKWRVLNINESTVELISDPPTSTKVCFQGALGYNNGVYLLDDFCNILYGNVAKGATARSLKIEDIQEKMDLNVWDYHDSANTGTSTKYGDTYTYKTNRYYPYQWAQERTEKSKIDGSLITGTLGESEQRALTEETSSQAGSSIETQQTYWYRSAADMQSNFKAVDTRDSSKASSMYYELLCNNGSSSYWLASRYVSTSNSSYAYFGLRRVNYGYVGGLYMFNSISNMGSNGNCVRPVVSLPSNLIDVSTEYDEATGWAIK